MKQIIRAQYRAVYKENIEEEKKLIFATEIENILREKKADELIYTGGLFCHENMLFLYVEYIVDDDKKDVSRWAEDLFARQSQYLESWPRMDGRVHWAYMYPVFWTDEPHGLESWKRNVKPEHGCGRIAVLYPDKLFSYVCHHQALVEEGLLVGDRFQFISLLDNILFSYFEAPRDNERVNIKRSSEQSIEIQKWEKVDPKSHFIHFLEAGGQDFLIIKTMCWVN